MRDSNFKKLVFDYSVTISKKKNGLSKKLKVSTLDIRIKQSGLKVSHSKVPSSAVFKTWIQTTIFKTLSQHFSH